MAIKIIEDEQPDIYLTREERNQLMGEYQRAYQHFCGTPPTFETFVKQRKKNDEAGGYNPLRC